MKSHLRAAGSLVIALVLLTGSMFVSAARGEVRDPSIVRHSFKPAPQRVRSFWTRSRMRNAPPITAAMVPWAVATDGWSSLVRSRLINKRAAAEASLQQEAPFDRREIADPSAWPHRLHGKLFVKAGRAMYHCSATALSSPNESVVFTAGHCLYAADIGGWVDSAMFVPGYLSGAQPYGQWVAAEAFAAPGWITEETGRYDIGALVMEPLDGSSLQDAIGGRGFTARADRQQHFEAYGYPAAHPFNGEKLYVCEADTYWADPTVPGLGPDPMGIGCDLTQGASGGGWIINGESLNSVNSYGYVNAAGAEQPYMFGPYFGAVAKTLFDTAGAVPVDVPSPLPTITSSPTPVPSVTPSPSPTVVQPRTGSRRDANDSRGKFDLANVKLTEAAGILTITVRTHDEWSARLLSNVYPRNVFFIDLDTIKGARPDYYLAVYSGRRAMVGDVLEYTAGGAQDVGSATVTRPTRRGFTVSLSTDTIEVDSKLRWIASSHFKSRKSCRRVCTDFAPNRGLASL